MSKIPLARYTLGKVSKNGWDILFESIRLFKKIYPEFDIVVCHNKLDKKNIEKLKKLNVDLVNQDDLEKTFLFEDDDEGHIRNFCWKLMPPRLRIDSHELWIDNDIILFDRIKSIDDWLQSTTGIISSGYEDFKDYGRFYPMLQYKMSMCAGFFGLPPNYDFESKVIELSDSVPLKSFDEQGLVALVVSSMDDFIIVPQNEIAMLCKDWKNKAIAYPKGIHFIRANKNHKHIPWEYYKKITTP